MRDLRLILYRVGDQASSPRVRVCLDGAIIRDDLFDFTIGGDDRQKIRRYFEEYCIDPRPGDREADAAVETIIDTGERLFRAAFGDPAPLDADGQATITDDTLPAGAHEIIAGFLPDDDNFGANLSETPAPQVVIFADATTTVFSGPSSPVPVYGQFVTFAAQGVNTGPESTADPTGSMHFYVNGTPYADPVPLNEDRAATVTDDTLPAGTHEVTASFLPDDDNFGASLSETPAPAQVVIFADATTTVFSGPSSPVPVYRQFLTFATEVVNASPESTADSPGSVHFYVDDVAYGDPAALPALPSTATDWDDTRVTVHAPDPVGGSLPWELLRVPGLGQHGELARLKAGIRRGPAVRDLDAGCPTEEPPPRGNRRDRETNGAGPPFRILFIISRPEGEHDVPFRSVAQSVVRELGKYTQLVHLRVLRPPTFAELDRELENTRGYDVIHFDGHGKLEGEGRHRQAFLYFEDEVGKSDAVAGNRISELLERYSVPAVVLNACQSAMPDPGSVYPSLGQELLEAGVSGVVAMAYTVSVETVVVFMKRLYAKLLEGAELYDAFKKAKERGLGQLISIVGDRAGRGPRLDRAGLLRAPVDPVNHAFTPGCGEQCFRCARSVGRRRRPTAWLVVMGRSSRSSGEAGRADPTVDSLGGRAENRRISRGG